ERAGYRLVASLAEVFVCHSRASEAVVKSTFRRSRGRTAVVPHGNYGGQYERLGASRDAVRERYGIPTTAKLLLAFGQVRGYKRLAEVATQVAYAATQAGDPEWYMLVAGKPIDAAAAGRLREVAAGSERVVLDLGLVPTNQVADLYHAADLALLNYQEVFSSGALLLSLTLGTAVVARESGSVREVADWPAVGFVSDDSELLHTAQSLLEVSEAERREAALSAANAADWDLSGARLAGVYWPTRT
ncbi:MAG: hypothetical protein Q7T73_09465, partial [Beijerinckiaceae bacterium]|nr:hypothetical protein [Beijerinckiaceae bacterium]